MRRLKAHGPYVTIVFHRMWVTLWVNYKPVTPPGIRPVFSGTASR